MLSNGPNRTVHAWEETISIPTYSPPPPDPNPMFFEKRVNQGASGKIYPNPFTDRVSDRKVNRNYTGLFLENEYLQLMLLPEIGGRIQTAKDKSNAFETAVAWSLRLPERAD